MMFKNRFSFEERAKEGERVFKKYPDRIPVICEPLSSSSPAIDKNKYLVPNNISVGQFLFVIRKRIKLPPEKALFLFVEKKIPNPQETMSELYNMYKSPDYFLYFTYSLENVFG